VLVSGAAGWLGSGLDALALSASCAVAAAAAGASGAETAFCSASHLRYSAFGSARTTIGMKPWSLPHNSAHWPR